MLRNLVAVALLLCLVSFAGCLSQPIGVIEAGVLDLVHVDGVVYSWLGYGSDSPEYNEAVEHFGSQSRTFANDLVSLQDDFDKHFLRYDKYDPLSE